MLGSVAQASQLAHARRHQDSRPSASEQAETSFSACGALLAALRQLDPRFFANSARIVRIKGLSVGAECSAGRCAGVRRREPG